MKRIITGLIACIMLGGAINTRAQTADTAKSNDLSAAIPPEMAARYANAKWTYPNGEQMSNMYPQQALNENVSGAAVILCRIALNGHLDKCDVMGEIPKGYRFGYSTAKVFNEYAHVAPETVEGGIKPGDFKIFIYKWVMN